MRLMDGGAKQIMWYSRLGFRILTSAMRVSAWSDAILTKAFILTMRGHSRSLMVVSEGNPQTVECLCSGPGRTCMEMFEGSKSSLALPR
jgi:hypothetical protein